MKNKRIEERLRYVETQIMNLLFMVIGLIYLYDGQKGDIISEIRFWLGIIFFGIGLCRYAIFEIERRK